MDASRFTCLAATLALVASGCAHLRQPAVAPAVAPGDLVRVSTSDPSFQRAQGTLVAVDGESLVLSTGEADSVSLPTASITRLELSRGKRGNGRLGAAFGFVGGAIAGTAIGYSVGEECRPSGFLEFDFCFGKEGAGMLGLFLGGMFGASVGAVVGSQIETEKWEAIPLDGLRVGLSPVVADGLAVTASLKF